MCKDLHSYDVGRGALVSHSCGYGRKACVEDGLFARMEQTAAVCQRLQEALVFGFPGRYSNDIGGFAYKTPAWCPRQPNGFDCGVYTMKLMQMTSVLWEGLQLELDSNTEWVKIAIDLFLDEGNRARDRGMKMIRFMSLRK